MVPQPSLTIDLVTGQKYPFLRHGQPPVVLCKPPRQSYTYTMHLPLSLDMLSQWRLLLVWMLRCSLFGDDPASSSDWILMYITGFCIIPWTRNLYFHASRGRSHNQTKQIRWFYIWPMSVFLAHTGTFTYNNNNIHHLDNYFPPKTQIPG